jgi:hypothetical protein
MHSMAARGVARRLYADGHSVAHIAAEVEASPSSVYRWVSRRSPTDELPPPPCPWCDGVPVNSAQEVDYLYLLGQYLGDGHLVTRARTPVLRIYATTDYPHILGEIEDGALACTSGKQRWRTATRLPSSAA